MIILWMSHFSSSSCATDDIAFANLTVFNGYLVSLGIDLVLFLSRHFFLQVLAVKCFGASGCALVVGKYQEANASYQQMRRRVAATRLPVSYWPLGHWTFLLVPGFLLYLYCDSYDRVRRIHPPYSFVRGYIVRYGVIYVVPIFYCMFFEITPISLGSCVWFLPLRDLTLYMYVCEHPPCSWLQWLNICSLKFEDFPRESISQPHAQPLEYFHVTISCSHCLNSLQIRLLTMLGSTRRWMQAISKWEDGSLPPYYQKVTDHSVTEPSCSSVEFYCTYIVTRTIEYHVCTRVDT